MARLSFETTKRFLLLMRRDTRELALSPGEDAERRGHLPTRKGALGHKPHLPAS